MTAHDAPPAAPFRGAQVQLVELHRDHPGFNDPVYRARRDEIAALASAYVEGEPMPQAQYREEEQVVWREVWRHLDPLHAQRACRPSLEALEHFGFDREYIPSFPEINARLRPFRGFTLAPVAGLVTPELFLRELGRRRFLATQYMRHHSEPLYTPEPDVVHEYIGHVPTLAHPPLAELGEAFGEASLGAHSDARFEALIRVYWWTLEFGVLEEGGELKAYGAGLLSSFGELGRFREADLRPFDLEAMSGATFDPTDYQAQLFVAPSFDRLRDALLRWLA